MRSLMYRLRMILTNVYSATLIATTPLIAAEEGVNSSSAYHSHQHGLSVGITKGASNWGTLYSYQYNLSDRNWQISLQSSQNRFTRQNGGGKTIVTADRGSFGAIGRYVSSFGMFAGAGLDSFLYDYKYENTQAYGSDQSLKHRSLSLDLNIDLGWQSQGPFLFTIGFRSSFSLKSPQKPEFEAITAEDGWRGAAQDTWDRNVERNFIYLGLGWYLTNMH